MRKQLKMVIVAVVWGAGITFAGEREVGPDVLLSRSLSPEAELRIVQGAEVSIGAVGELLPDKRRKLLRSILDLRVELHSKDAGAIVLGSILLGMPNDGEAPELRVLEAAWAEGQIVVVLGRATELWAHMWDLAGSVGCRHSVANLEAAFWSLRAKPTTIKHEEVGVRLTFTPRGTWHVHVSERVGTNVQRTTFEQVEGAWEFRVTSRQTDRNLQDR